MEKEKIEANEVSKLNEEEIENLKRRCKELLTENENVKNLLKRPENIEGYKELAQENNQMKRNIEALEQEGRRVRNELTLLKSVSYPI
jgi:prefoldin subunit 5